MAQRKRAILDPKQGTTSLRSDGYDVAIENKLRGGYRFVILNPFKAVYRISFLSPKSSLPVIVASSSDTDTSLYRRRAKNDPREPQDEVDALLLKLNPSRNPIDELSKRSHLVSDGIKSGPRISSLPSSDECGEISIWTGVLLEIRSA